MSNLSVCRLCLAHNVPVFNLLGTELQEIFEKLTENPLLDGNKPLSACYICHAKLKKCLSLRNTSQNAEAALLMILQANNEISYMSITLLDRDICGLTYNLSMTRANTVNLPEQTINVVLEQIKISEDDSDVKKDVKTEPQEFLEIDVAEYCDNEAMDHSDNELSSENSKSSVNTNQNKIKKKEDIFIKDTSKRKSLVADIKKVKCRKKTEGDQILGVGSNINNALPNVKIKSTRKGVKRKKAIKPKEELAFAHEIALTQEDSQALIRKRMDSSNFKNSPYKCELCYKGYFEQRAYDNHMNCHNEKSGKFECDVCRMRYKNRRAIFYHIKSNHYYLYQCKLCPYTCRQSFVMKTHYKEHTGVTHDCEKCGKKFKKISNYNQHARNVHSTDIVCTICGACLFSQKGLKDHMQRMHRDVINQQLVENEDAQDQTLKVQEDEASKKCMECNLQFNNIIALRRHLLNSKKHRLEMQVGRNCLVCGELLCYETDMSRKDHMKKHFREINFDPSIACDECGKVCGSVNSYRIHKSKEHLNTHKIQKRAVSKDKVICELCGKNILKIKLKIHQRTHTGEKPYKCDVCGKRLSSKASFQIHKRTHTGEKPYECGICGTRFNSPTALIKHKRVHTGEKPYKCEICGKSFSQNNSAKLHVHTVHMKLPSKYKRKPKLNAEQIHAE